MTKPGSFPLRRDGGGSLDDGWASMSFSDGSSGGSVGLLVESMDGAGVLSVAVGTA